MPLTIVGLGPGDPDLLTLAARRTLDRADRIVLRTAIHPAVAALEADPRVESFDALYAAAADFESLYAAIVARLVALHRLGEAVVYAVPGHPLIGEATVQRLLAALEDRPPIVAGLSFLEPVLEAAGIDPLLTPVTVSDALAPIVHPDTAGVFAQVFSQAVASSLKLHLLTCYPPEHRVTIVRYGAAVHSVELARLDHDAEQFDHLTTLVVPTLPLELAAGSFEAIVEVVRRLRAPGGCPWDRAQTNRTITKYLIEECYEAIDALESGNMAVFAEELGDVLLQVLLHAQIADDEGHFALHDVLTAITRKLVRRHPHVFGELQVGTPEEVAINWDALKQQERTGEASVLSSVPAGMPSLALAQALQERAARVGFDWPSRDEVLAKLREEIDELLLAGSREARSHELGDVLFVLARLASKDGIEAEEALRAAAARFRRRFAHIERRARETERSLDDLSLAEMDAWWNEAKTAEHSLAART